MRLAFIDLDFAIDTSFIAAQGLRFQFEVLTVFLEYDRAEIVFGIGFVKIQVGRPASDIAKIIRTGDNPTDHGVLTRQFKGIMCPDHILGLSLHCIAEQQGQAKPIAKRRCQSGPQLTVSK